MKETEVRIPLEDVTLKGTLSIPSEPKGAIIFSHGSGSSRMSPRNRYVAGKLQQHGFTTLLFDLLTREEDTVYENRFDIDLLAERLIKVTEWMRINYKKESKRVGYFGSSTGAACAIRAAADLGAEVIQTVVSRGGRPDLAKGALPMVECPVLLLVGGLDKQVIALNEIALKKLNCPRKLEIIPGASHLFEEEGKLELVTQYASQWFLKYLYRYPIAESKNYII